MKIICLIVLLVFLSNLFQNTPLANKNKVRRQRQQLLDNKRKANTVSNLYVSRMSESNSSSKDQTANKKEESTTKKELSDERELQDQEKSNNQKHEEVIHSVEKEIQELLSSTQEQQEENKRIIEDNSNDLKEKYNENEDLIVEAANKIVSEIINENIINSDDQKSNNEKNNTNKNKKLTKGEIVAILSVIALVFVGTVFITYYIKSRKAQENRKVSIENKINLQNDKDDRQSKKNITEEQVFFTKEGLAKELRNISEGNITMNNLLEWFDSRNSIKSFLGLDNKYYEYKSLLNDFIIVNPRNSTDILVELLSPNENLNADEILESSKVIDKTTFNINKILDMQNDFLEKQSGNLLKNLNQNNSKVIEYQNKIKDLKNKDNIGNKIELLNTHFDFITLYKTQIFYENANKIYKDQEIKSKDNLLKKETIDDLGSLSMKDYTSEAIKKVRSALTIKPKIINYRDSSNDLIIKSQKEKYKNLFFLKNSRLTVKSDQVPNNNNQVNQASTETDIKEK